MLNADRAVTRDRKRLAGNLEVAVTHGHGLLFVQASQKLGLVVAAVVDDRLVQPAEARPRVRRDIVDVEALDHVDHEIRARTVDEVAIQLLRRVVAGFERSRASCASVGGAIGADSAVWAPAGLVTARAPPAAAPVAPARNSRLFRLPESLELRGVWESRVSFATFVPPLQARAHDTMGARGWPSRMQIEAVTRAVLRRRAVVLLIWLAILLAGAFTSLHLSALLTNRISLPGTDSERAEQLLESQFGQSSVGSFTLVVKTEGSAHALLPAAQEAARRAAAELPTGAFVDSLVIDENVIIAQIASSLDPVAAKGHTAAMRAAVGKIPGAEIYLTGLAAAEHDADAVIASDLRRGELFIALPIAIVLLILIFRTFAFLLPIVFALFTIVTTLGLVRIFANLMELTAYITSFVSLIGLGIAVDYSLLIAHRFREELLGGAPCHEAIVRTMNSAGRAVVFSGSAVTIGLALLVFLPMPFLRGFGVGGLLMGVVSVTAALTLQPVLLSFFGERLDRVKLFPSTGSEQRVTSERSFWPELARWIMRRPVRVAAASALLLLALGMPLREIRTGPGSDAGQPDFLESAQGRAVVAAALGAGATTPTSIVIDTGSAGGANAPDIETPSIGWCSRSRTIRKWRRSITCPASRISSTRRSNISSSWCSAQKISALVRRSPSSIGCARRSSRQPVFPTEPPC